MKVIEIGDLSGRDIGKKVYHAQSGTVVSGALDEVWFHQSYTGVPEAVKLVIVTEGGKFELKYLPLDYVIQIEVGD